MKKILIFIVLLIPVISGCTANNAEVEAAKSDFGMNFTELNNEKHEATFVINGLPNKEEFAQVTDVITDSMKDQKVEGTYKVKVLASAQDEKQDPIYGTVSYKNGKLSDNKLKNITIEQYVELTNK